MFKLIIIIVVIIIIIIISIILKLFLKIIISIISISISDLSKFYICSLVTKDHPASSMESHTIANYTTKKLIVFDC